MKPSLIIVGLSMLFLVGAGCRSSASAPESTPVPECYSFSNLPRRLVLTPLPGKPAELRLMENPTTGYGWVAEYDPSRCRVKRTFSPPRKDLCGAPGCVLFEFFPAGRTPFEVRLRYVRPWEEKKSAAAELTCFVNPAF